eukprot:m.144620 g.144620  ORF g.144620 m.144620 type:complete len:85 (-) comp16201_c0_seq9:2016-2270(-)
MVGLWLDEGFKVQIAYKTPMTTPLRGQDCTCHQSDDVIAIKPPLSNTLTLKTESVFSHASCYNFPTIIDATEPPNLCASVAMAL